MQLLPILILLSKVSVAANISADSLTAGTLAGNTGDKITFSSSVYLTSDSSWTLQGAGGYVVLSSSVNASAFFGDGSNLSNVSVNLLPSTQTFSGANTFLSSFSVQSQGRQITLSTSSVVSNISISASGVLLFSPTIHNSSSTGVLEATTTNANYGPCLTGSTITITTGGGRVEVSFVGHSSATATAPSLSNASFNFLQDGQFVRDLSSTKGIACGRESGGGAVPATSISFFYLLDAINAGSHSYCLMMAAPDGGTAALTSSRGTNVFSVTEIR